MFLSDPRFANGLKSERRRFCASFGRHSVRQRSWPPVRSIGATPAWVLVGRGAAAVFGPLDRSLSGRDLLGSSGGEVSVAVDCSEKRHNQPLNWTQ